MLVLSRHQAETIMIGDDVEVAVVDIRGDKVRLGIVAPAQVPVHRKEVYVAIMQQRGSPVCAPTAAPTLASLAASYAEKPHTLTLEGQHYSFGYLLGLMADAVAAGKTTAKGDH